jgi:hypothetical protein
MMDKKECKYCKTEMVKQSVTDPNTGDKRVQFQCFHCGFSEQETIVEDDEQ